MTPDSQMLSTVEELLPSENLTPAAQPPEPPPPPNPPDQHTTLNPKATSHTNQIPHTTNLNNNKSTEKTTQNLNAEDRENGRTQEAPGLNSYRDKLIRESKHVYFPTWFTVSEMNYQESEGETTTEEEEQIPNICFTEPELQKFRGPWKKSLIIQTVDYKKSIPDIEQRLQRIWKIKSKLEIIDMGQGYYI